MGSLRILFLAWLLRCGVLFFGRPTPRFSLSHLPLILLPATRHFSGSFLLFGIIFLVSLVLHLYPMCHYTHPRFTVFVPLPSLSPPVLEIFFICRTKKKISKPPVRRSLLLPFPSPSTLLYLQRSKRQNVQLQRPAYPCSHYALLNPVFPLAFAFA